MDPTLEYLNNLGLPQWLFLSAVILWLLKMVGLLDPITNYISEIVKSWIRRKDKSHAYRLKLQDEESVEKRLENLTKKLDQSWLLEQYAQNHSDALSASSVLQEFVTEEISKKLDITIEYSQKFGEISSKFDYIVEALKGVNNEIELLRRTLIDLQDKLNERR